MGGAGAGDGGAGAGVGGGVSISYGGIKTNKSENTDYTSWIRQYAIRFSHHPHDRKMPTLAILVGGSDLVLDLTEDFGAAAAWRPLGALAFFFSLSLFCLKKGKFFMVVALGW